MVSKRHVKDNNPLVEGYDPEKPSSHIFYLDVNNPYGWAMSQYLPTGGFRWVNDGQQLAKTIAEQPADDPEGYILEVDLEYPEDLHDAHNAYPLAPERLMVQKKWMSEYQHNLLGVGEAPTEIEKLVPNLRNMDRYVLHYRNLQLYMSLGMRLTKVHRALRFDQSPWMEPYIRMNTELRKKAASGFEKDRYKLTNSSVFGKTMENLRKRADVKLVRSHEEDKLRRLIASPAFGRANIFDDGSYPGPQEPPDVRGDEHSGSLQAHDVRLLLQPAPGAVRGSLQAPLHRHRQPPPRGPDRGCLRGHGLPRRAL